MHVVVIAGQHEQHAVLVLGLVGHVVTLGILHREDLEAQTCTLVAFRVAADDALVLIELRELGDHRLGHVRLRTPVGVERDLVLRVPRRVREVVHVGARRGCGQQHGGGRGCGQRENRQDASSSVRCGGGRSHAIEANPGRSALMRAPVD
ncbi:hypothetical protein QF046_001761 [Microbacterium sp. W4I4]|nr:hypothetical protein [Microbacterium sp. W4I4]MDQ0614120.1 hypothetical protein [Microbacterium sp. W4I4]